MTPDRLVDPDLSVPYTLTSKAHAVLALTDPIPDSDGGDLDTQLPRKDAS